MASIELIEYIIAFALAIIFTIFAINKESSKGQGAIFYTLLASLFWFIFAFSHFIISHSLSGLLTSQLAWMAFGLGFIFLVSAVQDFFNEKKQRIWGFED